MSKILQGIPSHHQQKSCPKPHSLIFCYNFYLFFLKATKAFLVPWSVLHIMQKPLQRLELTEILVTVFLFSVKDPQVHQWDLWLYFCLSWREHVLLVESHSLIVQGFQYLQCMLICNWKNLKRNVRRIAVMSSSSIANRSASVHTHKREWA